MIYCCFQTSDRTSTTTQTYEVACSAFFGHRIKETFLKLKTPENREKRQNFDF